MTTDDNIRGEKLQYEFNNTPPPPPPPPPKKKAWGQCCKESRDVEDGHEWYIGVFCLLQM